MNPRRLSERLPESALALLIFIAAFGYFHSTLQLTLGLRDEGHLLLSMARVARGEIPHRDFMESYGPGYYALTAPVLQIFGDRVLPVRELLAVFRAGAVALSYMIARHLVPRPFALFAAFMAAAFWGRVVWNINAPYAAGFTIPLCMLSLALLLRGQDREESRHYIASGVVCGLALTFKWSLAAVSAYAMFLAICANEMWRKQPGAPPERGAGLRAPVLLTWGLAGSLILLPFLSTLTAFEYLLHLAPIHAVLGLVAIHFARFGDGHSVLARSFPLLLRYCLGFAVVPAITLALYSYWGALDDLFYNLVYRPLHYRDYAKAINPPALLSVVLMVGILCWAGSGLALLRGSRRLALGFAGLGSALAYGGYRAIEASGTPSRALEQLMLQLPAITAFAGVALLARLLSQNHSAPTLRALVAALLFQTVMIFQFFPRGGYDVLLMLGTLSPLIAFLSYRMYRAAFLAENSTPSPHSRLRTPMGDRLRPIVAFALAVLFPVLFVGDIVSRSIALALAPKPAYTILHSPALSGIRPNPDAYNSQGLAAFDKLLIYLERAEPENAPLLTLNNQPMVNFAARREHLFGDHALMLFLAGWGLLPKDDPGLPSPELMIERLAATPETIIITKVGDPAQPNFAEYFPLVAQHIQKTYQLETSIGDYRVLRRRRARGRSLERSPVREEE